ncbi:MAG: DUF3105 domain-containing protein [Candidatus Blackburnbacteria bacterium]|nr:DUF3105 domain-containing protein [Candidatus Blackburnbacteria bacterium]
MGNRVFILLMAAVLAGGGFWLWKEIAKPLPGQTVSSMGENHVTDISGVRYNSNPPTSGPHFPIWAKKGVYDRAISDGHLLHSLEHGYVVVSYNCDESKKQNVKSKMNLVYAHETDEPHEEPVATESADATPGAQSLMRMSYTPQGNTSWFTPENPPEKEAELPESFNQQECKDLVSKLSEMTKVAGKVIVVPRPANDSLIALTSWGRIDKMDDFDKKRIESFIRAWENKGPEKTVE